MKLSASNLLSIFLICCSVFLCPRDARSQPTSLTVTGISWNSDGIRLAIAYQFGPVAVIDSRTGETITSLSSFNHVNAIAWNPLQPDILAVAGSTSSQTGIVQLVDVLSGQVIQTLDGGYYIVDAKWSPDGNQIAASSMSAGVSPTSRNEVLIWDANTGVLIHRFPTIASGAGINMIEWKPDGTQIAGATSASVVVIWDVISGQLITTLQHDNAVLSLAWSPDSDYLATGSFDVDNFVRIWNTATWQIVVSYQANFPSDLAWNRTNELAIAENNRIRVIDTTDGSEITRLATNQLERTVAFSPYGLRLAFGGETHSHSLGNSQGSETRIVLAMGEIQIIIPDVSIDSFNTLLSFCSVESSELGVIDTAIAQNDMAAVIEYIEALPADRLPPACAADLIAVAEGLQAE